MAQILAAEAYNYLLKGGVLLEYRKTDVVIWQTMRYRVSQKST